MHSNIQTENVQLANVFWTFRYKMIFCIFEFCLIRIIRTAEVYSKPTQTSTMELLAKLVLGFQLLTIFIKSSTLDIPLGIEYASNNKFCRVFCFFDFIQLVLLHKQGKLIVTLKKNKNQTTFQQITEVCKKFNIRSSFTKVQGASERTFILFHSSLFFKF